MVYKIVRSDELYHHGILGQRWGTRNGPPYPLDASDHSAAEKKAGWKKSLGGGSSFRTRRLEKASAANKRDVNDLRSKGYNKEADAVSKVGEKINSKLAASKERDAKRSELINNIDTEKLKKAAKIGAAVAVTGLAVYGAYKYGQLTERATYDKYMALADKQIANAWKEHEVLVSDLVSKQVRYASEGNSFKAHELYEAAQREMDRSKTMREFSENLAYATARNRIVNEGNKQRRRNANNVIKNRVMK